MNANTTPASVNNGGRKARPSGLSIQKDYKIGKKTVLRPGQNKKGPLNGNLSNTAGH